MGDLIINGFDYSVIEDICRDDVRDAAVRIKVRMARTAADIIDIGRDLLAVKGAVGHGHFLAWIEAEFAMQKSTAYNFINVAQRFGDKIPTVGNLAEGVLYALAAPSTPNEVVADVVERAAEGEKFNAADIKAMKAEWIAEKKALREKADRALALKEDFEQQLSDLRQTLSQSRDEADTLKHELAAARSTPKAAHAPDVQEVKPDRHVVVDQANAIVAAWNRACPEAREIAMGQIDAPVFERTRAA